LNEIKLVKRELYNVTLPATPCTNQMNEAMRAIAKDQQTSLATVQRTAFVLFLDAIARDTNIDLSDSKDQK